MADEAVRVALRVRPLNANERMQDCAPILRYPGDNQLICGKDKNFTFDYVFSEGTQQNDMYEKTASPLVKNFLKGYNATIIAYGQTGSGKTYTMGTAAATGDKSSFGIIPRVVTEIFDYMEKVKDTQEMHFKVVFLEIHNEDIIDLLAKGKRDRDPVIREKPDGTIMVENVTEEEVKSADEMLACLERGSLSRTTASTLMNEVSSRSHAIFSVYMDSIQAVDNKENGGDAAAESGIEVSAKFHFVDLAGSERLKRTGASGQRMKEGISINSGLLALGNVISALGDEKRKGGHVPFRDSKITRLLQDSLGGNSKTLMIACVSPADINFEETLNTLKYANRARNIVNKAVINRDPISAKMEQMRKRIAELEAALAAGGSGPFDPNAAEELHVLKERIHQYETELQRVTTNLKQTRAQMATLSETLLSVEQQRDLYRLKLNKAKAVLADIPNPPDLGLDDLDTKELDVLAANLEQIHKLQTTTEAQKVEIRSLQETVAQLKRSLAESMQTGLQKQLQGTILEAPQPRKRRNSDSGLLPPPKEKVEDGHLLLPTCGEIFSATSTDIVPESIMKLAFGEEYDLDADDEEEMKALTTLRQVRDREHNFAMEQYKQQHSALEQDISAKEQLMQQLEKTREAAREMRRQYEAKINDMENEIVVVSKQRALTMDLIDKANAEQVDATDHKRTVVQYEQKLKHLQTELSALRSKLNENKALQAARSKDEQLISKLKLEIESHLKEKVKLARRMKEEGDRHREWVKKLENRVKTFEKESRVTKNKLRQLQSKLEKQAAVLKRRNEEKAVLSKRIEQQQAEVDKNRALLREQTRIVTTAAHRPRARSRSAFVRKVDNQASNLAAFTALANAAHHSGSAATPADAKRGRAARREEEEEPEEKKAAQEEEEDEDDDSDESSDEEEAEPGADPVDTAARSAFLKTVRTDLATSMGIVKKRIGKSRELVRSLDDEIERAVAKYDHFMEQQRLVAKRNEAIESKKKAEAVLSAPGPNLTEQELEYWRDRAEAFKTKIAFLNSQIVQMKVDGTKVAQISMSKSQTTRKMVLKKNQFKNNNYLQPLVLHLMDQMVRLKHEHKQSQRNIQDLQSSLDEAKRDVMSATRQSLMLQKTPEAKRMLADLERKERRDAKRNLAASAIPEGSADEPHTPTRDGTAVRRFLNALNVVTTPEDDRPQGRGMKIKIQRNNFMANGANGDGAPPSPGSPGSPSGGQRHLRSVSPARFGDRSRNGGSQRKLEDVDGNSPTGAISPRPAPKGGSVFDRLTDSTKYTGVYKAQHQTRTKPKPGPQNRKGGPRPASGDDPYASGDLDAVDKENHTEDEVQVPPTPAGDGKEQKGRPKQNSAVSTQSQPLPVQHQPKAQQQAQARPAKGGDVFSRLTDANLFTGVSKVKVAEKKHGGHPNKSSDELPPNSNPSLDKNPSDASLADAQAASDAAAVKRARSLSAMEKDLESLQESLASIPSRSRGKRGGPEAPGQLTRSTSDSRPGTGQLQESDYSPSYEAPSTPVHISQASAPLLVASPIDKQQAIQAVAKLDSLFARRKGRQNSGHPSPGPAMHESSASSLNSGASLFGAAYAAASPAPSNVSMSSASSPPPKAHEVLQALALVFDGSEDPDAL